MKKLIYLFIVVACSLINISISAYTRTIGAELADTYSNRDFSKFSRLSSSARDTINRLYRPGKFIAIIPTDNALTNESNRDTDLYSFLQKNPELAQQSVTDVIFDLDKEENSTASKTAEQLDAAYNETGLWLDNIGHQTGSTLCRIASQYGQLTLISISDAGLQNSIECTNGILYKSDSHIISSNLFEKLPTDIKKKIIQDIKENAAGAPIIIYTLPEVVSEEASSEE